MEKPILYPKYSNNIKIVRADGFYLYDENNKKYIDLTASAGVVNVGYNNAEIKEEMKKQMERLIFSPQTCRTNEAEDLAERIYGLFPKELNTILKAATGSESVEIAMKMAKLNTKRDRFMSFDHSYHGHTIATLSLGNEDFLRKEFKTNFPKVKIITPPYLLKIKGDLGDKCKETLKIIEKNFKRQDYAAFITEGMLTSAGCLMFNIDFFQSLSKLCKKYGVLLIFDEVLTGFGRTGKMFSFEHFDIVPDIVCISKGLGSGYVSIASVITKEHIGKGFDYFSTYAWTPLACSASNKNIEIILRNNLVNNSRDLGEHAIKRLKSELAEKYVADIRGIGLEIGIELSPLCNVDDVVKLCADDGVFLSKADLPNTFLIHPPLNINKAVLDESLNVLIKIIIKNN